MITRRTWTVLGLFLFVAWCLEGRLSGRWWWGGCYLVGSSQDVTVQWFIKNGDSSKRWSSWLHPPKNQRTYTQQNDGALEKVAPAFKYGHFWYQFVKFLGCDNHGSTVLLPQFEVVFKKFRIQPVAGFTYSTRTKIPSFRSMICVFFCAIFKGNSHCTPLKFNMVHLKMMFFLFLARIFSFSRGCLCR